MDDQALAARVETVEALLPRHARRRRTASSWRSSAAATSSGYLGDGINDAPSLHSADVGISVDGAVDVAKEAADLILLEHDLGVLHDGVLEGRRTFGNIMKYVMMGTSSNFGNMFSMAGAPLVLPFLPMLPIQILVNNFLYDLSEIADPARQRRRRVRRAAAALGHGFIRRFMMRIGPVSSVFDFLTFFVLLHVFCTPARRCSRPAGSSSRWRRRCWSSSSSARAATRCAAVPTRRGLVGTSLAVVAVRARPAVHAARGAARASCRRRPLFFAGARGDGRSLPRAPSRW